MRQLVSVVTDTSVSYFLADEGSDEVHQVAQVLNTGLGVPDVIDLGGNLLSALKLNGKTVRGIGASAPAPAPTQRVAPPPPAPLPPAPRKPGRKPGQANKRPARKWGFSQAKVLEDLRAHPGTTYLEACDRLTGSQEDLARQAYSATLSLVERDLVRNHPGTRVRRIMFTGTSASGRSTQMARLYLEEPQPQPELEPELELEQ